jgi:hypothetical protein
MVTLTEGKTFCTAIAMTWAEVWRIFSKLILLSFVGSSRANKSNTGSTVTADSIESLLDVAAAVSDTSFLRLFFIMMDPRTLS